VFLLFSSLPNRREYFLLKIFLLNRFFLCNCKTRFLFDLVEKNHGLLASLAIVGIGFVPDGGTILNQSPLPCGN
jgi:hypothetical protein